MFCCELNHVPPKSKCCSPLLFGFETSPWVNVWNAGSPVDGTILNAGPSGARDWLADVGAHEQGFGGHIHLWFKPNPWLCFLTWTM